MMFDTTISMTTIRKLLSHELQLSYKKIYRGEVRANYLQAKQKRQLAAKLYAHELALGKKIINIDESTLDLTSYIRRGWGPRGK